MSKFLVRFLCLLGFHDFCIVEKLVSWGSGDVEKVQCKRCGLNITRQG